MKSASASSANSQGLSQVQKGAPAFEQLLWDAFFSKQANLLLLAVSRNVCFGFVD